MILLLKSVSRDSQLSGRPCCVIFRTTCPHPSCPLPQLSPYGGHPVSRPGCDDGWVNTPAPISDNQAESRFEATIDGHRAELLYRRNGKRLVLIHTEVPEQLEGHGIGGALVAAAIDRAVRDGMTVVPLCPFARGWLERHPDVASRVVSTGARRDTTPRSRLGLQAGTVLRWSRPGSAAERRARLAARHHLAATARAGTAAQAADGMIALHGTDPASVYLAIWARSGARRRPSDRPGPLRGTDAGPHAGHAPDHVRRPGRPGADDSGRVHRSDRRTAAPAARPAPEQVGIGVPADAAGWLKDVGEATVQALTARGTATGAELAEDEPRLRTQLVYDESKSYGGPQSITSRPGDVPGIVARHVEVADHLGRDLRFPIGMRVSLTVRLEVARLGHDCLLGRD